MISALLTGLILSFLALGVFISFRIFKYPDLTVDGSFATGAAVAVTLIFKGVNPVLATILAFCAGSVAGMVTGILFAKMKINNLLSGILVMTALYSVNLHIMGQSGIVLFEETTIFTYFAQIAGIFSADPTAIISGTSLSPDLIVGLVFLLGTLLLVIGFLSWLFRTDIGMAIRTSGENTTVAKAQGINVSVMQIGGIAISNGLVALSGALLGQFSFSADPRLGPGMLIAGLAALLIGETVLMRKSFGWRLTAASLGAVLFQLLKYLSAIAGLDESDFKLFSAVVVLLVLLVPVYVRKRRIA